MQQQHHLHQSWLWLFLLPLLCLTSCSGADTDDAGSQHPATSSVPISFTALSKWDEAQAKSSSAPHTRLSEDATTNTVSFAKNDAIGVFAYLNNSDLPNFMNNQEVTYDGANWNYSPVKYWPSNEEDKLSFYAYYPYDSNQIFLVVNRDVRKPSFVYSNQNLDYDLMVSDKIERSTPSTEPVSFTFKHLMAKVIFTFTYTSSSREEEYEPVVHMIEFGEVPYSGTFSFDYDANNIPIWNSIDTVKTTKVKRFTKDSNGVIVTDGKKTISDLA